MSALQRKMPAPVRHGDGRYLYLYYLIPLALTVLAFSPCLNDTFTNWDDGEYVADNPLIRSLSLHRLCRIFSPATTVSDNYQPLTILSLAINYAFGKLTPTGYIAVNVLLHLCNVLLVFIFVRKLSRSDSIASLTALLFGIHPMHVESVAWVTGRKDVLYSFFFLAALIGYLRYLEKRKRAKIIPYCAVLLLFICSLLSKSAAVTLPAILLLIDYYLKRTFSRKIIVEKLPLLLFSIVLGGLAIQGQATGGSIGRTSAFSLIDRVCIACYSYMFYTVKFLVPIKLSAFYPYPPSRPAALPLMYMLSPLFAGVTAAAAYFLRRSRVFLFGFFFFLISVFFILHFIPVGATVTADRFSYLPYIGLSFIIAHYADRLLWQRDSRPLMSTAGRIGGVCIIALLTLAAHERCKVWRNSLSLWNNVLRQFPSSIPFNYRGLACFAGGDYAYAIASYDSAVMCNPRYAEAYFNRALAWNATGNPDRAIADFDTAIGCNPAFSAAYNSRGLAWYAKGDYRHAVADYEQAVDHNPGSAKAYYNRGIAHAAMGEFKQAILDYSHAIALNPDYPDAYYNKGQAYLALNDFDNAIDYYSRTVRCDTGRAPAYNSRGIAYCMKGDYDHAIADYNRAIAHDPAYIQAYINRGNAFMGLSDYPRAIRDYSRAILHDPSGFSLAYYNRGIAYAATGDREHAGEDFRKACDMHLSAACTALAENGSHAAGGERHPQAASARN
jgi:tetratricopeptide (TPR) repeat protein